ncbi:MAG: BLUF domain-containing protein [Bacteroidota bacterium]
MKPLTGIVYLSEAIKPFDQNKLDDLVGKASTSNLEIDITGFLLSRKNHFLQYIEGENRNVRALMQRIEMDTRHQVRCICTQPEMTTRKFQEWGMRLITEDITVELALWDYLYALAGTSRPLNDKQRSNIWRMVDIITYNQQRDIMTQ